MPVFLAVPLAPQPSSVLAHLLMVTFLISAGSFATLVGIDSRGVTPGGNPPAVNDAAVSALPFDEPVTGPAELDGHAVPIVPGPLAEVTVGGAAELVGVAVGVGAADDAQAEANRAAARTPAPTTERIEITSVMICHKPHCSIVE